MNEISNLARVLNEVEERLLLEIEPEYEKTGKLDSRQLKNDISKLNVACSNITTTKVHSNEICEYFKRAVNLLDKYN